MKEPHFTYLHNGEWRDWREMEGHTFNLPGTTIKVIKVGVHKRLGELCVKIRAYCPCGCGAKIDDNLPLSEFVNLVQTSVPN